MTKSMTGFASLSGTHAPHSWGWELRAVNGKGLDLRVRVPDWIEGLEIALRKALTPHVARGNVTLNLRIQRDETGAGAVRLNEGQLTAVLDALTQIEDRAMAIGVSLAPSKASDIAAMRGVLEQKQVEDDTSALKAALLAEFDTLVTAFNAMRAQEGTALAKVLGDQLDEIAGFTQQASDLVPARQAEARDTLHRNLEKVMSNTDGMDEARIAQELALIAVKSDITEEIDRLRAHVDAARALLDEPGPVGRKFDFLMQEFNREANTLCSKAQNKDLTQVGLALKTVIDQMREQVQNVE